MRNLPCCGWSILAAAGALGDPGALGEHLPETCHPCIPCFSRGTGRDLYILDVFMGKKMFLRGECFSPPFLGLKSGFFTSRFPPAPIPRTIYFLSFHA